MKYVQSIIIGLQFHIIVNSFKLISERLEMTNIWKINSSAHKVRDKGLKVGWLRLMSVSVNKQGVKWQK